MIIPNGTIQIYSISGDGISEDGNPVKPSESLGEPIKCNWNRNAFEKRGVYENGVFTSASYIILVDMQKFEPCRFRLCDSKGNILGDYEVRQKGISFLSHVNCIELTV